MRNNASSEVHKAKRSELDMHAILSIHSEVVLDISSITRRNPCSPVHLFGEARLGFKPLRLLRSLQGVTQGQSPHHSSMSPHWPIVELAALYVGTVCKLRCSFIWSCLEVT